jgi:hypothetical protein
MMTTPERLKILKMLEAGKIKADEAARLLEALGETGAEAAAAGEAEKGRGKTLHIRVFRGDSERPNVNVNVPLSLAKWALKFVPADAKARVGDKEVDLDELGTLLDEGVGELVTVEDEDKDERVVISIK